MTNNDKLVNFKAPETTVEEAKAKLEHGEMSQRLREALETIAHGADVAEETRLTDRLQSLREERRTKRQERDAIEADLEEINRDIERVEQRLDNLREQQGEYDGVLAMLEEDLKDGRRILESSEKVIRAAELGDCSAADVIGDLKDRNPDVPDAAYWKAKPTEDADWQDATGYGGERLR